jgi:hypothetical protein
MADEHTKPAATEGTKTTSELGVDLESVQVEDMELSEQQLRLVSGGAGKGYGGALRAARVASFQRQQLNLENQNIQQVVGA